MPPTTAPASSDAPPVSAAASAKMTTPVPVLLLPLSPLTRMLMAPSSISLLALSHCLTASMA